MILVAAADIKISKNNLQFPMVNKIRNGNRKDWNVKQANESNEISLERKKQKQQQQNKSISNKYH